MIRQGSTIIYHPGGPDSGKPSEVGIVLRLWGDGTAQIYALSFESAHNVRAAHPTEMEEIGTHNEESFRVIQTRLKKLEAQIDAFLADFLLTPAKMEFKPLPDPAAAPAPPAPLTPPDEAPLDEASLDEVELSDMEVKRQMKTGWPKPIRLRK